MIFKCPFQSFPNHLSLLTSSFTGDFETSSIFFNQEELKQTSKKTIPPIEKSEFFSEANKNFTKGNLFCSSIIFALFIIVSSMFLWIKHTRKINSILKLQNQKLLNQTLVIQKSDKSQTSFSSGTNNAPVKLLDSVFIKNHERMVKISLKNILYIRADRNYCSLHTLEKEYLAVMPLKELNQKLPSDNFLRIHRSFIINLLHIDEIGTGHVIIARKSIPLGKSSKIELLKRLQTI